MRLEVGLVYLLLIYIGFPVVFFRILNMTEGLNF